MSGANRFRVCTGSYGSSHHPTNSPELADLGLCALPKAKIAFQFDVVGTDSSPSVVGDTGGGGRDFEMGGNENLGGELPSEATRDKEVDAGVIALVHD